MRADWEATPPQWWLDEVVATELAVSGLWFGSLFSLAITPAAVAAGVGVVVNGLALGLGGCGDACV